MVDRRRHPPDPADRPHHAVPVVRRLVAGRELGDRRDPAAHLRRRPTAAARPVRVRRRRHGDDPGGEAVMNKPIRTVSIFCLLLFLALALNATYLQYYHANALNDRVGNGRVATATFSRERGAILVGRTAIAESVRVQGPVQVPAHLSASRSCTPRSPAGTPSATRPASSARRTPSSPARTTRLFVNRLVDLVNGNATKGGNVAAHDQPRGAEGGVRRAARARRRRAGRRRGDRAEHRQDPGDGVAADLRPEQAGRPRLQEGRRPTPRSCRS